MDDLARGVAQRSVPWKEGQSWWIVAIEGIIALIIGIYIVANPAGASDILRVLIALVLLVVSLGQILEGFRSQSLNNARWATLRGGVGATVAALTLLSEWSAFIDPAGARQILAIGLLAYGILGIVSLIFTMRQTGLKVAMVISDVLTIVLGLLLLFADANDTSGTQLLGAAAIVGGVALLIYCYRLWNASRAPA